MNALYQPVEKEPNMTPRPASGLFLTALFVLWVTGNTVGAPRAADAELPTVVAKGGEGVHIDWLPVKIKEDNEDGPGFFYRDCAQGVDPVAVSSTLPPQGNSQYDIGRINDDDPMTAWVEGSPGDGVGEWFEFKAVGVNSIHNGYQASPQTWKNNARIKTFKVYKDNVPLCYLELTDEMGEQRFELPGVAWGDYDSPYTFRFEIVAVYPGDRWTDAAVSEIDIVGCCLGPDTRIATPSGRTLAVFRIAAGQTRVTVPDIASAGMTDTLVLKTARQIHLSLLKISTPSKQIEVTRNHPLYVKGHGFICMDRLLPALGCENYTDLIGRVELMTFNPDAKTLAYEPLTGIRLIKGEFTTYTLRELEHGTTFVANGFVSRTD